MQSLLLLSPPSAVFSHFGVHHGRCDVDFPCSTIRPPTTPLLAEPYSPPPSASSAGFMSSPSTAPDPFWPATTTVVNTTQQQQHEQLLPQHQPVPTRRTKAHVASACVNCKKKHLGCDSARPCRRCILAGKAVSSLLSFISSSFLPC